MHMVKNHSFAVRTVDLTLIMWYNVD